jgi:hypothetical protein
VSERGCVLCGFVSVCKEREKEKSLCVSGPGIFRKAGQLSGALMRTPQVNWREPWLIGLCIVHVAFATAIWVTRRSLWLHGILFLTLGEPVASTLLAGVWHCNQS